MAAVNANPVAPETNVEPFYTTADRFWTKYERLAKMGPTVKGTPLEAEYAQVMQKGASIHKVIDALHYNIKGALTKAGNVIQDKYQDAAKWVSGAAQSTKSWFGLGALEGLGLLPLVAVAGIAAAITAMTGWMASADDLEDKLNALDRLKKQGYTDQQAAAMVKDLSGSSSGGVLGKLGIPSFEQVGKIALITVGVYLLGRKFGWWGGKRA